MRWFFSSSSLHFGPPPFRVSSSRYLVDRRELWNLRRRWNSSDRSFDLVVIGGGSGGLACSQEAADLGKKVALLDYVVPSPHNSIWGLGGTCVNVGCIPKKLMHFSSLLGDQVRDAQHCGWNVKFANELEGKDTNETKVGNHDWRKMVSEIQNHIKSLNWGYRVALRKKGIQYFNARAKLIDSNEIECQDKDGKVFNLKTKDVLIAVGGRPRYLDIPGSLSSCITSDDLFSLSEPPGKTLVIGAGYVALECAGFLTGLGFETAVMSRSKYLRSFDQQMVEKIVDYMQQHGTRFINQSVPLRIDSSPSPQHKHRVYWKQFNESKEHWEDFDTVLVAIGREPSTKHLGLETIGLKYDPVYGKIPVTNEQTNIPNIYAVGDIVQDGVELTPVAIQAGRFLARRLYGNEKVFMNYDQIPTTVFTPLEYATVGFSEEKANEIFGEENVEIYHAYYKPLEWTIAHREDNVCYTKLICNKKENEKVIGIHILGPHSGEILQGLAIAMKCGATKKHFDETIGIHPTVAEEVTLLRVTKRSGLDAKKTGC